MRSGHAQPNNKQLHNNYPTMKKRIYDLNTITHGVITLAVIVVLYLLVRRLSGVLLPFIISWCIAYLMNPLVRFFQYKCRLRNRVASVVLALLTVLLTITALCFFFIPPMIHEMQLLSTYVADYVRTFQAADWIPASIEDKYEELIANMDIQQLLSNPDVTGAVKSIAPRLWGLLTGSVNALSGLAVIFVCLLYIVFILIDYDKMTDNWSAILPARIRPAAEMLVSDLTDNMNRYFRGQAKVATCVGILFAVGFEIIGLPLGIIMGLFIGLLNMVPYLQVAGIPPCILLGILQSAETGRPLWLVFLLITLVFIVVQSTQDLIITPRIMGGVTGLNPAIILLALSIWGSLLGVVGMLIALPVTSLIVSYYKRFVLHNAPLTTPTPEPTTNTPQPAPEPTPELATTSQPNPEPETDLKQT